MTKEYIETLKNVKLFDAISEPDIGFMLSCLEAKVVHYEKNAYVLLAGNKPEHIGILLKGSAHVVKEGMSGERVIITTLSKGGYFAEALCCAGVKESPVSVVATEDTVILMVAYGRVLHSCPNSCTFHTQLIRNMLFLLSHKNILLQGRIDVISQKTLREKVLSYLHAIADKQEANEIVIPLNREEFADFLCVDRSALSHELARMKKDGLIEYRKNRFIIFAT